MRLPWYLRQSLSFAFVAGLGGVLTLVSTAFAQPWSATSPRLLWSKGLAMSADGRTIVAAGNGMGYWYADPAPICISTDAGQSWAQTTASNHWSAAACSADGLKLVAVTQAGSEFWWAGSDGLIYTSPDAGGTWTPAKVPTNNWTAVASSADGLRLAAVTAPFWDPGATNYVGQGAIYRSSDAGATWTKTTAPNTNFWQGIASSADGTKLAAVSEGIDGTGGIYRSLDGGVNWERASAPSTNWTCIAASADGVRLFAGVGGGLIYTSSDSGATWTWTSAPTTNWVSVACSADGEKLVAGCYESIYTSSDAGATWAAMNGPGIGLRAIACSADGYRLAAAGPWHQICTWPYSGRWRLAEAPLDDNLRSIACSADGTHLVAGGYPHVYRSVDSGASWIQTTAQTQTGWSWVAASSDGARLLAASQSAEDPAYHAGAIYRSSDTGLTWHQTSAPGNNWTSVASSADGTRIVASAVPIWSASATNYLGEAAIYRSPDAGTTWVPTSAPSNVWHSVASSADGTKLMAVGEGTSYHSSDAGATWTSTSLPNGYWVGVASSADGAKLVAVARELWGSSSNYFVDGAIYHSSDAGMTWSRTTAPSGAWAAVASSADGKILVALPDSWDSLLLSVPEISTDSGASWAPAGVPAGGWESVATSADGSYLIVSGNGQSATLSSPAPVPPTPPSPRLAIYQSKGDLSLSWLAPSTQFILQQNFGLRSADWVAVPTPPTLNLTNLRYQVTLPAAPGAAFYRLKHQ
jgi:photosystem II stability/assembly factor-like uncharacterized protein